MQTKSIVYTNICKNGKKKSLTTAYVGESQRRLGERTREHWEDRSKQAMEHMYLLHSSEENDVDVDFKISVNKEHISGITGQVVKTIAAKMMETGG